MADVYQNEPKTKIERIKITVRITLNAYDAITELQRKYRGQTGRALPLWKIVDRAVKIYAGKQGIEDIS